MNRRTLLIVLAVALVLVILWNILIFAGVIGGPGIASTGLGVTQAPDPAFDIPVLTQRNPRPQVTVTQRGGTATQQRRSVDPRGSISVGDLEISSSWGRNPLLTPQEIWAVDNYQVLPAAAPDPIWEGGLQLSAILGSSDGRRTAVINDTAVGIGDVVAGMEIIDVWDDAVVFRVGSGRHVLRMEDAAVRLTVRGDGAGGQ